MKTSYTNNSALDSWYTFLKSLDWRDDRDYLNNVSKAFEEAIKLGVWFQNAFTEVAKRIYYSGRCVNRSELKQVWHSVLSEWDARQNDKKSICSRVTHPHYSGGTTQPPPQNQGVVKSIAPKPVKRMVVIDGTNVLFGSISNPNPSLLNLIGLMDDLQKRQYAGKCFFDANTYHQLVRAGKSDEADIFDQLCRKFPDNFIIVAGGTQADEFLLDFADSENAPVISNDRFRDYNEKYRWLVNDPSRRASFLVHSGIMQVVQLSIRAVIPTGLAHAMTLLEAGLAPAIKIPTVVHSAPTKRNCGAMVLRPA
jgi:hypothetical protein